MLQSVSVLHFGLKQLVLSAALSKNAQNQELLPLTHPCQSCVFFPSICTLFRVLLLSLCLRCPWPQRACPRSAISAQDADICLQRPQRADAVWSSDLACAARAWQCGHRAGQRWCLLTLHRTLDTDTGNPRNSLRRTARFCLSPAWIVLTGSFLVQHRKCGI